MSFKSRLNQLQRKIDKESGRDGTRDFAAEDAKRWEMIERLFELAPEDLHESFADALMEREEAGFSTRRANCLHAWICDLGFGRTRLPDDLVPETMRQLLWIYLEDTPLDAIGKVCEQCGLYRPHKTHGLQDYARSNDYFEDCPHCGCREWTWSCRVSEQSHPWQRFLEAPNHPSFAARF
jgi:hypothetical protein